MKTHGKHVLPSAAEKIPLLEKLRIFQSLSRSELLTVARQSYWKRYRKGEAVMQNQSKTGRLFVVYCGEVAILRKDEKGGEMSLATFDKGGSFGEFSLFEGPRKDTVARCEEDTTLLAFPRGSADPFFVQYPSLGAKILNNLLGMAAERIRATNRLIAEKTPWVQELRRRAMVDKLTGLYNTGYLEEDFPRLIDAGPEALSLLMVKPDDFKSFNDNYGHETGDRVLQLMAAETKSVLGGSGTAVRFRGDVFAVVLPGLDAAAAEKTAARLQHAMRELDLTGLCREAARQKCITVCIGLASLPDGGASAPALIDRAYENLFRARERGANRICTDDEES